MVRITNAVASHRRKKKLLKRAKGFWGDRKNHRRLTKNAVMHALSDSFRHRRRRKGDFRRLWITRIGIASQIHGISYSKFIFGLKKMGCLLNRKTLSEMAIHDSSAFASLAKQSKTACFS